MASLLTRLTPLKPLAANSFRSIFALATLAIGVSSVHADPVISEFMAANSATLADEDGAYSDWIELHNPDAGPVDLTGWYLTDSASKKTKWQLPAVSLPGGGYLVIFASSKNRRDPAARLHTNFALSADGEYLALIKPDGMTAAFEYAPAYPDQEDDVPFGLPASASGFGSPAFLRGATPGRANEPAAVTGLTETATFSQAAGPFRTTFSLQLAGATGDQKIRYVLAAAGNAHAAPEPTAASPEYAGPITIDESTLVRAAVFSADGTAHGPVTDAYYARLGASLLSFSSQLPVFVVDNLGAGPLIKDGIDHPSWLFSYTSRGSARSVFGAAPELVSPLTTSVRGSSSADFPKKGYNIKFTDASGKQREQSLFDLSAHEKWALVAPWSFDLTYINNAFVGRIDMNASTFGIGELEYDSRHPELPTLPLPANFPDPVNVGDIVRVYGAAAELPAIGAARPAGAALLQKALVEEFDRGDANQDGHVDEDDFPFLAASYDPGHTNGLHIGPANGDFTGDNLADLADYEIFVQNWDGGGDAPAEPASTSGGCVADLDNGSGNGVVDGAVDINDLVYFLIAFENGSVTADLDNGAGNGTTDSAVDISDLLYFIAHFEVGC